MRRFTRLTNAFSKKIENHCHSLALYFVWYNWVRIHKAHRTTPAMAAGLTEKLMNMSDIARLDKAKNGRLRVRKKALTVLARKRGISNAAISELLHSSIKSTRHYFKLYSEAGLSALFGSRTQHSAMPSSGTEKTRHIFELLHQKPTSFGINRTSWTQKALIQAYKARYNETISRSTVRQLIKDAGYSWRKARRVLTSPDPDYREKVELLGRTLLSLSESELFFFLDEWGPVQVRKRGGKAYSPKHAIPRIPRLQTSKGTVDLVAALSATTNQMTWTFTKSKDTHSMASLLEILYNQYQTYSKLYVTWDALSWHNSTELMNWLDQFNETSRRHAAGPVIDLLPLPTSAQFLNVIEGVLSAMTRAVINNSDYSCPDDMKLAISRHFNDRNQHFKDNPRRAGKVIWDVDFFHGLDAFSDGDCRNGRRASRHQPDPRQPRSLAPTWRPRLSVTPTNRAMIGVGCCWLSQCHWYSACGCGQTGMLPGLGRRGVTGCRQTAPQCCRRTAYGTRSSQAACTGTTHWHGPDRAFRPRQLGMRECHRRGLRRRARLSDPRSGLNLRMRTDCDAPAASARW